MTHPFLSKISSSKVATIYGEEPFFREELYRKVLKQCEDWDQRVYDGEESTESEVLGTLQEFSLSGSQKLVVLRNPEKLKTHKNLDTYLDDPSEDTLLLFYSSSGEVKKSILKKAIDKYPNFKSEPLKPFGNDFIKFVQSQAKTDGYTVPDEVARIIVLNVGTNLFLLRRELEKIYLCIDGKMISRNDLPGVLSRTVVNQVFEFTEAVGLKDTKKAFKLLANIHMNESEPSMWILSSLMNHFEKLLKFVSLKEEGFTSDSIAEQCEIHPFRYKKVFEPQIKSFTIPTLIKHMKKLCDLDVLFRTSISDKRVALEAFLAEVCSGTS